MSDRSPHLSLPYLQADQAQKHVTVNEAFRRLDMLAHLSLASRTLGAPPANAEAGARYLVAAGASGAWENHDGEIAAFQDGGWIFYPPQKGWTAWLEDEKLRLRYDGSAWQVETASGDGKGGAGVASAAIKIISNQVRCSGASVDLTAHPIPAGSMVLALTARITTALAGPSGWQLGVENDPVRYGAALSGALGDTHKIFAPIPVVYYQETPLRVTAPGGTFTAGTILVDAHILEFALPAG